MVNRRIPREVKEAAILLYEGNVLPLAVILDYLPLSRATFFRVYAIWRATGDVVHPMNGLRGRPSIFHFSDIDYLKLLIEHRPNWFLDELLYLLETNRFISEHFTTIQRELIRAGTSLKKICRHPPILGHFGKTT